MDTTAFEIDTGLTGIQGDEGVDVQGTVSNDESKNISVEQDNGHDHHRSANLVASKNDRRFIARDWFNSNPERDCDLMQIFINQLNSTNHVNYSKAYVLFKERTGFPFSDPKHMRKRMDQIVYTFKNRGDVLPQNVKSVIADYNNALESAKQRDSSNRKRLSVMEPVEMNDTSDDELSLSSGGLAGRGSNHQDHQSSAHVIKKRKQYGNGADEFTVKSLKKLNDNVERMTKMLEIHQELLNKILGVLDLKAKDPVIHLNAALNVNGIDSNHDPNVYSESHVHER